MPVNPVLRALRSTLLGVVNFVWPESFTIPGGPLDPLTSYTLPALITYAIYFLAKTAPGPNDVPSAASASAIATPSRPQWLHEHDLGLLLLETFVLSYIMWMYA